MILNFSTSVQQEGEFPPGLDSGAVNNREALASLAEEVYDTYPNLVVRVPTAHSPVVIKWFGWRHPLHRTLSPTFPSRAYISWVVAHDLKDLGARTPLPLYVLTRRQRGVIRENFFITRAIHPHIRLRSLLVSNASEKLMNTAITDLARSVARIHEGGIFHGDLTTGNFLVDDTGQTYMVDLNRARRYKRLSTHQKLADLARISFRAQNPEHEERLTRRFFQVYQEESGMSRSLLEGYRDYRKSLTRQRRLGKRLRNLVTIHHGGTDEG